MLAAVRALQIAVVLDDAEHRNVHHLGHLDCLADDHGDQILRRGDDDDAVYRQGLEYGQRYVARAGRHVDEQEVYVLPYNVRPELLDGLRDDRTAVDDRVILVRQDQIDRDHLHAAFAACRDDALLAALELVVHAEGLGDGRTGNVGIQHAAGVALARHADRHHRSQQALAYAALAGNNADHLADGRSLVSRALEALLAAAVRRTAVAVVRATHIKHLLTYRFLLCISIPYSSLFRKQSRLFYF